MDVSPGITFSGVKVCLPNENIVKVTCEVKWIVITLHSAGLVHEDVRDTNIVNGSSGTKLKLTW